MKNRMLFISLLLISASLVLAACQTPPIVEEEPDTGEKTIYVGPELKDCVGTASQKCMQVKDDPNGEYTLFFDQIEGFDYEPGYEYELLVNQETVENPPADGSSIKWSLIEEVSKTAAAVAEAEVPTAIDESTIPADGEVLTVFVGPELVDCVGVAPQTCLQVRLDPTHDYNLFYDQIKGFEFEPGFEYELKVLIEPVEDPPADASTLKYTLVEEVSMTPAETSGAVDTGEASADGAALEGPTWSLISLTPPDGQSIEPLPDSRVTAVFEGGKLAGTAGCNNYFGTYESDGSALTIGPAASTMMMCNTEVMVQETAYLATLSFVSSYEIIDDQLHLKNEAGETILLFAVEETLSLTDVSWILTSYNNGQGGMVSVIIDSEATISFNEDGSLSGSAGCNNYFGSYEADGEAISIGNLGNTEMFCASPEGVMEQEGQYLAVLTNAAVYSIDGSRLEIRDANGSGVAYYEAGETAELTGKTWNLLFHNNGQGSMVSTIIDTQITAVFDEEGGLAGSAGCNNYTAGYEAADGQITIGPAVSTRMFCAEPEGIMEQEGQYLIALEGAATYTIEGDRLEIRDADGSGVASYEVLEESADAENGTAKIDNAVPETPEGAETTESSESTDEAESTEAVEETGANKPFDINDIPPEGAVITLYIGPELVDCVGVGPRTCMQVKGNPNDDYTLFYDNIEGFEYEPGYEYELKVLVEHVENPPADASSLKYTLVEEVSKTAVEPTSEAAAEETEEGSETEEIPAEILDGLANASYPLDHTGTGTIQLTDGEYREQAAEDSAAEIVTRMTEHVAMGELANGQQAVAVILTTETGGTGTFFDMVVVSEQDGMLTTPASVFLGDRIIINSLTIEDGQIVVDMVNQGPDDPFCCPTQNVIQTYSFDFGQLEQVSNEVVGAVESETKPAPDISGILWKWQELVTPVEQITIDNPDNYTVEFTEDGLVNITANCNVGSGTYELDGSNISIKVTATTLALCPEGSHSDLFFSSLSNAGIYFMDGENLMIDQFADGGTLRFFK